MKLGKKPFEPDVRDVKLRQVAVSLPAMPTKAFGGGTRFADWGMLGNDVEGDCVAASAAHQHMLGNSYAGRALMFETASVLADYHAVGGPGDDGLVVRDYLLYRKNTGILGGDTARHKIQAFAAIDAKDWETMIRCVWTFGWVEIGFEVPSSIWDEFNAGVPLTVHPGARIIGGHDVPIVGSRDPINQCTSISWGTRMFLSREFYETYNDEAWVPLTNEALLPASNIRHIDWAKLNQYLAAL